MLKKGRQAMDVWVETLLALVKAASTDLPEDVRRALVRGRDAEEADSNARRVMDTVLANADAAREAGRPICQDTGTILVYVQAPACLRPGAFRTSLESAVVDATRCGVLRQNCVDPVTGVNTGTNLAPGHPVIHWGEWEESEVEVAMILKGGGCENVGAQYALPDESLGAGRDLEGVRRCLLHAVEAAQGRGCSPGVLGVAVGGDRATGYEESKRQLLRPLGCRSEVPELADLERRVLAEANTLGIGPMGYGGRTTLLDVLIGMRHRVPASYFVTVSYMCWCHRRRSLRALPDGTVTSWVQ